MENEENNSEITDRELNEMIYEKIEKSERHLAFLSLYFKIIGVIAILVIVVYLFLLASNYSKTNYPGNPIDSSINNPRPTFH